jgi:hypothetical protein
MNHDPAVGNPRRIAALSPLAKNERPCFLVYVAMTFLIDFVSLVWQRVLTTSKGYPTNHTVDPLHAPANAACVGLRLFAL